MGQDTSSLSRHGNGLSAMIAGRPLWFVLTVVGSWTALRMVSLLPADGEISPPVQQADGAVQPSGHSEARAPEFAGPAPVPSLALRRPEGERTTADAKLPRPQLGFTPAPTTPVALASNFPSASFSAHEAAIPGPPAPGGAAGRRWSGAAWLLWRRDGGEVPLARAGRLGSSQVGLRLDYALDRGSPLRPALYGRLSGALAQPVAAEAAVGVALRPTGLPLSFALERRAALSRGGRDDFAFIAAGGIDRRPLTRNLRLGGYAQAGFVGLPRPDAFIDGRLTVEGVVSGTERQPPHSIAIGTALWGGAQPGIARLDIGPQATVRMPVGASHVRLATEWRQRIAGRARPPSGPSITIGLDF